LKKKKKKKAKEDLLKEVDETETQPQTEVAEGGAAEDETLDLGKKKKKSKVVFDEEKNEVVEFEQPVTDKKKRS